MFKLFDLLGCEFAVFRHFHQLSHPFTVAWVKADVQDGFRSGTRPICCVRAKHSIKDRRFTLINGMIHSL